MTKKKCRIQNDPRLKVWDTMVCTRTPTLGSIEVDIIVLIAGRRARMDSRQGG